MLARFGLNPGVQYSHWWVAAANFLEAAAGERSW
jgi:hypothetical protein